MSLARRRALAGVRLAALGATISCGEKDPTPPGPALEGTYALHQMNGRSVPLTLWTGLGGETRLTRGSLVFVSRGRVLDIKVLQEFGYDGRPLRPPMADTVPYAYSIVGDSLFVHRTALYAPQGWRDTAQVLGGLLISLKVREMGQLVEFRNKPATLTYIKESP